MLSSISIIILIKNIDEFLMKLLWASGNYLLPNMVVLHMYNINMIIHILNLSISII